MLVPCAIATMALGSMMFSLKPASLSEVPYGAWAFLVGFGLWLVLFLTMPRPVRIYVLAHELTHALWGWVSGARVSKLKVGKSGGSVAVSENNILITLAPYFFPLYAVIVLAAYGITVLFMDVARWQIFWLAAIGLTWSFHVTFTISTLLERQSDLKVYGHLLSLGVIYLFNVLEIGLWIVAVSPATIEGFVRSLAGEAVALAELARKAIILMQ